MKPILLSLHLGGREVGLHTYGILIGVGCAVAIALAFRELAENATKIGELNISPDLLRSLIGK